MKLLIDANIFLDVLQNREPFVRDSSVIWKLCETEKAKGYSFVIMVKGMASFILKNALLNVSSSLEESGAVFGPWIGHSEHVSIPSALQMP